MEYDEDKTTTTTKQKMKKKSDRYILCASILQGCEMSLQHSKNCINKMDIRYTSKS